MDSHSNSELWMGASASDMSMLSNLEEESPWKTPASSQNTTYNVNIKDTMATPNFGKGLLEEQWYTPDSSIMELSSYAPSPYSMIDARSSFGLLESPAHFDPHKNSFGPSLSSGPGFHSVPSSMCMDDLGQGAITNLFSVSGGQLDRSVPLQSFSASFATASPGLATTSAGFAPASADFATTSSGFGTTSAGFATASSGLATPSFNHPGVLASSSSRPTSFAPYTPFPALPQHQHNTQEDRPHNPTHEVNVSNQSSKSPQQQLTLFQKRAECSRRGIYLSTSYSPRTVVATTTSASNDSPGKAGSPRLHDDSHDMGLDADVDEDDDDVDESGDGDGDGSGKPDEEDGAGNAGNAGKGGLAELVGNASHGKGKSGNKIGKPPAKNLMAERRRRKKLNDRLYLLRSVVPKITKMDRASILGDAIEYLKELMQRINDLHEDIEKVKLEHSQSKAMPSSPVDAGSTQTVLVPVVKDECPLLPSPENQPPRVEVRLRDQAFNIHMFCARRPGLLLSTVQALDALGLDVQQAVISCFNGFAMDLFRAEAKNADVGPEEIKAVLLHTAGCGVQSMQ